MSKVSFTPCIKKKYSKDKHGILNIRVTQNRKSKYVSLRESVNEKYWNPVKKEVRRNYKDSERLNEIITNQIEALKKELGQSRHLEKKPFSFVSYLLDAMENLEKRNKHSTYKRYKTTYYHLKKFLARQNRKDLTFHQIDAEFVQQFETYLLSCVTENTSKNYLNCIKKLYHQKIETSDFSPQTNAFALFVNKRKPVEKKYLNQSQVEVIMKQQFDQGEVLYNTKNYFLWQIFCQGMRVRDLVTIRFGNIVEGRLIYTQTKTRKIHRALLTDTLVFILKDYVDDERISTAMNNKFEWGIEGIHRNLTYSEIVEDFNLWRKKSIRQAVIHKDPKTLDLAEKATHRLDEIRQTLGMVLQSIIKPYSKRNPRKFVFPILRNEDFQDVVFDPDYQLTKYQNNQIEAKVALYNKRLKLLQAACNIDINISSHIARHTYSNLMLENEFDVYTISKSLGHQRLSTTENYLTDFNEEKVESGNIGFDKKFPVF